MRCHRGLCTRRLPLDADVTSSSPEPDGYATERGEPIWRSPQLPPVHAPGRLVESVWLPRVEQFVAARPLEVLLALLAAAGMTALVALNRHAPLGPAPFGLTAVVAAASPILAGLVAGLAVVAPWAGLVAYVGLMPALQLAQVGLQVGWVQVILTGAMTLPLVVGWLLLTWRRRASVASEAGAEQAGPRAPALHSAAPLAVPRPAWLLPGALAAIAATSTLLSPDRSSSVPVGVNGWLVPIAYGCLVVALRPSLRQLWALAAAVGLSAALGSAINLYQILPIGDTLSAFQQNRTLLARLTYFNVGIFGEVLAMSLPLLLAVAAMAWRSRRRGLLLALVAAAAISFVSLYLTFSKSAWLATGMAIPVLAVALVRSRRIKVIVVCAVTLAALVVIPYPAMLLSSVAPNLGLVYQSIVRTANGTDRFASWDPMTSEGEVSITERAYATNAAIRMAIDHPLFGVGPDQFQVEYDHVYKPPKATRILDSAHDFLANVAAEIGLLAAALVALLLGAAIVTAWRAYARSSGASRLLAASLGTSLLAWIVVAQAFDVDFYRWWRLMDFDMLVAAVLVGAALALPAALRHAGAPDTAPAAEARPTG